MKLLPTNVVVEQVATLRNDDEDASLSGLDVAILYFLPVAFGIATGFWGALKLDVAAILAAVAVFTGLVFNLAFHIFDKSLQMRRDPFQSADPDAIGLVEGIRTNVNYTVLVGILLTAGLTGMLIFDAPAGWSWAERIANGTIAGLLIHMLLMSGMVLKRFTILHNVMKP